MRPRSALLAAATALLLVTAGCVSTPGGPSTPTDSPTEASPDAATSTAASATTVPGTPLDWPDGPKERPRRPETLTESSVREFVNTTEYRYVYNSLWYDDTTQVDAECAVDSVTRESGAWRAVVTCTAYSNTGGGPRENGTGTSTVVHADYFTQTWVYWVTEDSVHRVESDE